MKFFNKRINGHPVTSRTSKDYGFTPLEKINYSHEKIKNCTAKLVKNMSNMWNSLTGFTILELIIAFTILSLIVVIIGSGFRLGINAWEKGEAEIKETQRLRSLSGLISQSIKSAYPYEVQVDGEKVFLFKGDSHSVVFVTTLVNPMSGGFKWVRYLYSDGALLYKEGVLPDKKFLDVYSGDEEVIDSNIGEIKFEYLAPDSDEWEESWTFSDKLPNSLRVTIAYFHPFIITIPSSFRDSAEGT